jgi:hypothetical protein
MNMSDNKDMDTQYGMLFKFMNQSRSKYMGLDLTYNFELLPENRISVDIFAEGNFDLPIRTKQMFRNMFMEFFVKDSKYFNIPKNTVGLLDFNNISLNGERLGDRITMDNNFKKDLVDIDGKLKKYYSIDLEDYPQGSFKLESFDNDLKSYIDLIDEDSMMYTVNIDNSKKITLNGNEFNRNTIVDFLDSVDIGSPPDFNLPFLGKGKLKDTDPDSIFESISNAVWENSVEGDGTSLELFWDKLMSNGMNYQNYFMENIGMLSVVNLNSYDGMFNDNMHNYNTESQSEVLSIFVGWLETNKGKYKL